MNFIIRLYRNPTVRRFVIWAAPFVISYVTKRLSERSSAKKSVKSKTR